MLAPLCFFDQVCVIAEFVMSCWLAMFDGKNHDWAGVGTLLDCSSHITVGVLSPT